MKMYKDTEIRKLPSDYLDPVAEILEVDEQWKEFMSLIPKNVGDLANERYEPKYNGEHIRLIENYARDLKPKVNNAKVLFSEWGTSGRVRPTLATVQALLIKGEMFKAADQIAVQLGEPLPPRPSNGPAARIDTSVTQLLNEDSETLPISSTTSDRCNRSTKQMKSHNLILFSDTMEPLPEPEQESASNMIIFSNSRQPNAATLQVEGDSNYLPAFDLLNPPSQPGAGYSTRTSTHESESHFHSQTSESTPTLFNSQSSNLHEQIDSDILGNNSLIHFNFNNLEEITNNFSGTLIGSGLFGDVFLGNHGGLGLVAVKKAHDQKCSNQSLEVITKMFNTEVRSLSMLQHENIVPIIGFSLDGPAPCIVCEYIDGGSLKQKIAEKVLTEIQRIKLIIGTAEGLKYIHNSVKPSPNTIPTSQKAYFIHKDVKSANILLTKYFVPKLCDFGLAEKFDMSVVQSEQINGTPAYMAPESSSGTITQKGDVYSFGIVMLEILTGKTAVVYENHEQMNIKDYVEENSVDGDITHLLDNVVEKWVKGQSLYGIARLCLNKARTLRPAMDEICIKLQKIHSNDNF